MVTATRTHSPPVENQRSFYWLWGMALGAAVLVRLLCFDFESYDYRAFLSSWYDFLVEQGRWQGLGKLDPIKFCNYPPLYMTLFSLFTWLPS